VKAIFSKIARIAGAALAGVFLLGMWYVVIVLIADDAHPYPEFSWTQVNWMYGSSIVLSLVIWGLLSKYGTKVTTPHCQCE